MGVSRRIILPVAAAAAGSGVSLQMASRLAIMAAILFNLSHNSPEAARGPPRALNNTLEHRVRLGDRLRLSCSVDSDPPSLVEWHKDGRMIHDGWDRFRISPSTRNHSLTITSFSSGDRGRYVCRAANGFGSIEIRHHVRLTWSPSLRSTEEPETYLAPSVGSSMRLLCRLPTGSHDSAVTWYKDGVLLSSSSTFDSNLDDVINEASLTLKDVTLADSGVYECRDSDGANEGNVTYVVDVIEDRSRPSFIQAPSNVMATFGGTVSFFCHVRSDTVPHIQWLKQVDGTAEEEEEAEAVKAGMSLVGGGAGGRVVDIDEERFQVLPGTRSVTRPDGSYVSKLLIRNVRSQDEGLYLCTCTNNNGYIVGRAQLTIRSAEGIVAAAGDDEDDEARRGGLSSAQPQDLPILSLLAVLAVLAILVLFAILTYAIYRSRFGVKPPPLTSSSLLSSSSAAVVDHTRRWAALPANNFRRSASVALLDATPEPHARRSDRHRYAAVVASTIDQRRGSYWSSASIPVDLCTLRSNSPTPGTVAYSPVPTTTYAHTNETTYSPTPGTTYLPTNETMYSPTPRTMYSPTLRSTYAATSGSGYSACASARGTIAEVTSQFVLAGRSQMRPFH